MTSSVDGRPDAEPARLDGVRILIVEDSWSLATAVQSLRRAWGADVLGPAATTADAMRLISERVPDVALVDINLRNDERADGLVDHLHDRGIRVVVMSGYAEIRLPPEKVAAILPKPVREAELLASLRPRKEAR